MDAKPQINKVAGWERIAADGYGRRFIAAVKLQCHHEIALYGGRTADRFQGAEIVRRAWHDRWSAQAVASIRRASST